MFPVCLGLPGQLPGESHRFGRASVPWGVIEMLTHDRPAWMERIGVVPG
jgi:hypothetical protein